MFNDPLSITFPDPDHSIEENRYVIIGVSRFGQLLIVRGKYVEQYRTGTNLVLLDPDVAQVCPMMQ